jgi:hypothetical protein
LTAGLSALVWSGPEGRSFCLCWRALALRLETNCRALNVLRLEAYSDEAARKPSMTPAGPPPMMQTAEDDMRRSSEGVVHDFVDGVSRG